MTNSSFQVHKTNNKACCMNKLIFFFFIFDSTLADSPLVIPTIFFFISEGSEDGRFSSPLCKVPDIRLLMLVLLPPCMLELWWDPAGDPPWSKSELLSAFIINQLFQNQTDMNFLIILQVNHEKLFSHVQWLLFI